MRASAEKTLVNGDHQTLQSIFKNQNQQHCDWMMRVSEDQHYGCSHEHLYIVLIKFNQQLLKQTKDTCWRNWRDDHQYQHQQSSHQHQCQCQDQNESFLLVIPPHYRTIAAGPRYSKDFLQLAASCFPFWYGKYGEGQPKTIQDIKARHLSEKLASECRQKKIIKINKVHINIYVLADFVR